MLTNDQVIHATKRGEEDLQEVWTYQAIKTHRREFPFPESLLMKVVWNNGEAIKKPVSVMREDGPLGLARCAFENNLTNTQG